MNSSISTTKTTLPIYENLSKALQVTSRAKILRIEICNPGLPPSLTGFTTSTKINAKGEFVLRRRIFTPEHDKAVRNMLGVVDKSQCTFDKYILPYVLLKARYVRSVSGYGSFILVDDLPQFISDATEIKNEFDDLRQKVRDFLKDELHLQWIDILHFNPRLRYSTYILNEGLANDDDFRWNISHMMKPFRGSPSIDRLLGTESAEDATT